MLQPQSTIFILWLAAVVANVDARGNARDTTLATYNAALIEVYLEVDTRASILTDEVKRCGCFLDVVS